MVGDNGTILTTPDAGVNWTTRVSGTAEDLLGVAYDPVNLRWVAVGTNGTILYSDDDGVTWAAAATVPVATDLHAVAHDGVHGFLAAGASNAVISSTDGDSWAFRFERSTTDLNALAWRGTEQVLIVGNASVAELTASG